MYIVSLPCVMKLVACLVEGCLTRAYDLDRIRKNFMHRNWKAKVAILKEGPPPTPRRPNFRMNIPAERMEKNKQSVR